MKVTVSKEGSPATFSVEAIGIQAVGDVKEVIRQLQQIEKQMQGSFVIEEGRISEPVASPGINTAETITAASAVSRDVYIKGVISHPTTDDIKTPLVIDASGISTLAKCIPLNGNITFSQLNVAPPFILAFTNLSTGEKLGELKEKDGLLTFEGKADDAAKIFFDELIKNKFNPKKQ